MINDRSTPNHSPVNEPLPALRQQLNEEMKRGRMSTKVLCYWGERFVELDVFELCQVTFEQYLRRPRYYEGIVRARQQLGASNH